jgi:glycosyltransferase involved in cell wall biosynthesis
VGAIVTHSEYGRSQLVEEMGVAADKVSVIHHGAFEHLAAQGDELPLPDELAGVKEPVVLFFGLLRPYKGIEVLLEAWREVARAELWVVGQPRIPLGPLTARAPSSVRFVPRFVPDRQLPAFFRRADVVVLPYTRTERFDFSGVMATALAFGKPVVVSDIGGFSELAAIGAARLVRPGDPAALSSALAALIDAPRERERLAEGARAAAAGPYAWDDAARRTIELYETLSDAKGV